MKQRQQEVWRRGWGEWPASGDAPLQRQYWGDDGGDSGALGKGNVVDESMSGRLFDLDRRKIRVGREEGTIAVVGRLGVISSDADSASSIYPSEGVCCAVRAKGLV